MNSASTFFRTCRAQRNLGLRSRPIQQSIQHRAYAANPVVGAQHVDHVSSTAEPQTAEAVAIRYQNKSGMASTKTSPPSQTSHSLPSHLARADAEFLATSPTITARVSRVGTMSKTVRVSRNVQVYDKFLRKHYIRPEHALVHDPTETLLEGDVIKYGEFPPSERAKRTEQGRFGKGKVKYVVREVITPFGVPLDQRTPRTLVKPERVQGGTKEGRGRRHHARAAVAA